MAAATAMAEDARRSRAAAPRPDPARASHSSPQGPEWELVLRIAASRRFERSALLTSFLLYICERALSGSAASINEHQIGVQVFGRDAQFNRSDDNIVRNYARMLRQRIDDYFANEGREEPLRLQIPRGGYVPVFVAHPAAVKAPPLALENAAAAPLDEVVVPPTAPSSRGLRAGALWLLLAMLAGGLIASVLGSLLPPHWWRMQSQTARLNHAFWRSIFTDGRDAVLVPSDGGLVILHRFIEQPTSLSDYIAGNYRSPEVIAAGLRALIHTTTAAELPELSHKVETLGDRRYTSIVDLDLTSRLSRLPEVVPERLLIRYARELRMDDLKTSNVVLIGSVDANPWVELFQPQLNFQFTYGGAFGGSAIIVNRRPRPGEAASYASITGDPAQRTYGVIAYVPNLGGTGHVLIVEGINMAGTEAAGEFLLDPQQMAPILSRARAANGELRPFEVLLETSSIAANSSQLRVLSERIAP